MPPKKTIKKRNKVNPKKSIVTVLTLFLFNGQRATFIYSGDIDGNELYWITEFSGEGFLVPEFNHKAIAYYLEESYGRLVADGLENMPELIDEGKIIGHSVRLEESVKA